MSIALRTDMPLQFLRCIVCTWNLGNNTQKVNTRTDGDEINSRLSDVFHEEHVTLVFEKLDAHLFGKASPQLRRIIP
jgi:hypothetical protein